MKRFKKEAVEPQSRTETEPASGSKPVAKPRRSPRTHGILMRVLAVVICLVTLGSVTTSAFYLNDFLALTEAQRSVPGGVTRSLSRSAQKLSYAPSASSTLKLAYASAELDLSVSVLDDSDELVTGYPFQITVTPLAGGDGVTLTDEDMDGQVYFDKLTEGNYTVAITKADGYLIPDPITATVEPQVTYEKVDVSDKIVTSKDINVAQDDKQYANSGGADSSSGNSTVTPPTTTDTVEYVASSSKKATTTKTVDKTVNGVQVYWYKPQLSGDFLVYTDGTVSDLVAVLDASGYLVEAKRAVETPGSETPTPEVPAATGDNGSTAGTGDTTYVTVSLIDSNYNLTADPQTGKTIAAEKIKATETVTQDTTTYYGWQTLNGKTYFYDKNGVAVTGWQVIQGVTYFFAADGARGGSVGIDVSTWQGSVNWSAVKAAGIDFVFIRLGFRGYGTGKLVVDDMYYTHMNGAIAAGLKVGVYFFTQAINEREAVEEASMCLELVRGYSLSYPIAIDIEYAAANARTNGLNNDTRTKICRAFCETIRSGGYTPAVYANKYYFTSLLNTSELESYVIWLAHYTEQTSYSRRYDIWQYSSKGTVNGVSGYVDMNISYLGY